MSIEDDKAKNELLSETKKLAEELLKNPEYAEKAIRDRNIIIRGLKADIEHRKVAFKEIAARYDDLSDTVESNTIAKNNALTKMTDVQKENEELKKSLSEKNAALSKAELELEVERRTNDKLWVVKLQKVADGVTGWKGMVFRFLVSKPVVQYFLLSLFVIIFAASFFGWPGIAALLAPIFKLLHI